MAHAALTAFPQKRVVPIVGSAVRDAFRARGVDRVFESA